MRYFNNKFSKIAKRY